MIDVGLAWAGSAMPGQVVMEGIRAGEANHKERANKPFVLQILPPGSPPEFLP